MSIRVRHATAIVFVSAWTFLSVATAFASEFKGIEPGVSRSGDIRGELGTPVTVRASVERFTAERAGIAEALVGYDEEGQVLWARIRTVKELSPETAAIVFMIAGSPVAKAGDLFGESDADGITESYDAGVHLYIEEGRVKHVWMTREDVDVNTLRARINLTESPSLADSTAPVVSNAPSTTVTPAASTQLSVTANHVSLKDGMSVQVLSVTCTNNIEKNALDVKAHVRIVGMNGQPMQGSCVFRLPNGNFLVPTQGADASWADAQGLLRPLGTDMIRFDTAEWKSFQIFAPYSVMNVPKGTKQLTLFFFASCGSMRAMMTREFSMPVNQNGPPMVFAPQGVDRELRLGGITCDPNGQDQNGNRYLVVKVESIVNGMNGKTVNAKVHLRQADGAYVRAKTEAGQWRDNLGNAVAGDQTQIQYDLARFAEYTLYLPVSALDLPSGQHSLIAEFLISCDGLAASIEQVCTIEKP